MIRAAFFVDGFNAYHALDQLRKPWLKWLDWWALAGILIPQRSEELARVVYCTALRTDVPSKLVRHRHYINALKSRGVICREGHFAKEERKCLSCGAVWQAPVEKQGDVNLAISIIDDAHLDLFDHCYLVTADGDQFATAKMFKERFPAKKLTSVTFSGQFHSRMIFAAADAKLTINEGHIGRSLFPRFIPGGQAIIRPSEYDPPAGWQPPSPARPDP